MVQNVAKENTECSSNSNIEYPRNIDSQQQLCGSNQYDSNSGIHNGAAKYIEVRLGLKFLSLAYRCHISEIIVGAIWEKVFESIFVPENKIFANFKTTRSVYDNQLLTENLDAKHQKTLKKEIMDCSKAFFFLVCTSICNLPYHIYFLT